MKRLIKDGNIILDGTAPEYIKEQEAFKKLEIIEQIMFIHKIDNLSELDNACYEYHLKHEKVSQTADLIGKKWFYG